MSLATDVSSGELVKRVSQRSGYPATVVRDVLTAFVRELIRSIRDGVATTVHRLGTFAPKWQAGTGTTWVRFSASRWFRESVAAATEPPEDLSPRASMAQRIVTGVSLYVGQRRVVGRWVLLLHDGHLVGVDSQRPLNYVIAMDVAVLARDAGWCEDHRGNRLRWEK